MRVSGIFIYPVKSLKGISLFESQIVETGFLNDRILTVADKNGVFISQRTHPKMSLINCKTIEESIVLEFPDGKELRVKLQRNGEKLRVDIWDDFCDAIDQGKEAADALSFFLNTDCRLALVEEKDRRTAISPKDGSIQSRVRFADAYPFLLISEESLEDLNSRLEEPVPMNRFRPNITIEGMEPFGEDKLSKIKIGDVEFSVVKPCERCSVTTVDQATGVRGKEPLKTLSDYRRDSKGNVIFGQNLIHHNLGKIRVGDKVSIL